MKEYICIDIDDNSIRYSIINESENLVLTGERGVSLASGGLGIVSRLSEIISGILKEHRIYGICISTIGIIDPSNGEIVYSAPDIPNYSGILLKDVLESLFHIPCEIQNAGNCMGLSEYYSGSAKDCSRFLFVSIGNQIESSIITDGRIFGSGICELGNMHYKGSRLGDEATSRSLVKRVTEVKKLNRLVINAPWVFDQARDGDIECIYAIDELTESLGTALSNACYIVNPQLIVLGGNFIRQKDYLFSRMCKILDMTLLPYLSRSVKLAVAEHKEESGMLGAYYYFQQLHGDAKRSQKQIG